MTQLKDDIEAYLQAHTGTFSIRDLSLILGVDVRAVSKAIQVLRKWHTIECVGKDEHGCNLWRAT